MLTQTSRAASTSPALLDDADTDPAPFVARAAASDAAADLQAGLECGYCGIHTDDVAICLDADRFAIAMSASDSGTHVSLRAHTCVPISVGR